MFTLEWLREVVWIVYNVVTMSNEGAVTIVLAALAVMLAILTVIIGIAAIWGFVEMRNFLRRRIEENVQAAVTARTQAVKDDLYSRIAPNLLAISSKPEIQENLAVGQPHYPEEPPDASHGDTGHSDAGPNNS